MEDQIQPRAGDSAAMLNAEIQQFLKIRIYLHFRILKYRGLFVARRMHLCSAMTLRIARDTNLPHVLRLSGWIQSRDLDEVKREMQQSPTIAAIDLEEVTLVNLEVVRFLAASELAGVRMLNASAYIRDWVAREKELLGEKGV